MDEFQDANVAQIKLIELLGRTSDRPDNVMVVSDDDQSSRRSPRTATIGRHGRNPSR